jgi:hypothetical protein
MNPGVHMHVTFLTRGLLSSLDRSFLAMSADVGLSPRSTTALLIGFPRILRDFLPRDLFDVVLTLPVRALARAALAFMYCPMSMWGRNGSSSPKFCVHNLKCQTTSVMFVIPI